MKRFHFIAALTVFMCTACNTSREPDPQLKFSLMCVKGEAGPIKTLLASSHEININAVNDKVGPCLSSAAYGGHVELVEFLLSDPRTDVNVLDQKGAPPLVHAVIGNQTEVVRILLNAGADTNLIIPNDMGKMTDITVMKIAKIRGNPEIISMLENSPDAGRRNKSTGH